MLKLARYLPENGLQVSVLTVANPSAPLLDPERLRELPESVKILRARTWEPGYATKSKVWDASVRPSSGVKTRLFNLGRHLLVPEAQLLWLPGAVHALAGRLRRNGDDVVLISGPPFSQFLLAPFVRMRSGARVVLDYRDEWSAVRENYEMMSRLAGSAGRRLESLILPYADRITVATEGFRRNLLRQFPRLPPHQVAVVPNGFDRADLPTKPPPPPGDRFVVTYAGTVFHQNSVRGLLGGLRRLGTARPDLIPLLRVRFIGRIVETERQHFEDSEAFGVERVGFLPQREAIEQVAASHLALCTLDDVPYAARILPAKVFELMALGRPCLILAPEGELTRLAREHRFGTILPPRDEALIASWFEKTLEDFRRGEVRLPRAAEGIERFDRRRLAESFADLFRDLARPRASE